MLRISSFKLAGNRPILICFKVIDPSFALRIPTAHDFCVISACIQNIRDSPQTKLDSEINARFLLNEHRDPHFLFYKFN